MSRTYYARLSDDEKSNMKTRLGAYLGRHVASLDDPPDLERFLPTITRDLYSGKELAYWDSLHNWWVDQPDNVQLISRVARLPDTTGYTLRLHDGHVLGFQVPEEYMRRLRIPIWEPCDDSRSGFDVQLDRLLPEGMYAALYEWSVSTAMVIGRVARSARTLSEVVDMASTVGQLNRMAPDLIKYVYAVTREALAEQQRRSPLPPEWMDLDRKALRDALDHLALCHILPEQEQTYHAVMYEKVIAYDSGGSPYVHYHARHRSVNPRWLSTATGDGLELPSKKWTEEK